MQVEDRNESCHNDQIVDASVELLGNKLALANSQNQIKIYSRGQNAPWEESSVSAKLDSSIRKIKWAHPDFGFVLACLDEDGKITIWEEKPVNLNDRKDLKYPNILIQRAKIELEKEIVDIKFGSLNPAYNGLTLAVACENGQVKIFQTKDGFSLESWQNISDIELDNSEITCLSWSKSARESPMIIIGTKSKAKENPPVKLRIFAYQDFTWVEKLDLDLIDKDVNKIRHEDTINDVSWAGPTGIGQHMIASCGDDKVIVWYVKTFSASDSDLNEEIKLNGAKVIDFDKNVKVVNISFDPSGSQLAFTTRAQETYIYKSDSKLDWVKLEKITKV